MVKTGKSGTSISLVRLSLILPLLRELEERGLGAHPVLQRFNLRETDFEQAERFVPAPVMYSLVEALAESSHDRFFGVKVGEKLDPWSWAPLAKAARMAGTVGDFLLRFVIDASRDQTSVTFVLETRGIRATFQELRNSDGKIMPRHNDGFTIAYLAAILSGAIGDAWEGHKVLIRVCDPGAVPNEYRGARIAKTDTLGASITFPCEWLLLPVALAQSRLRPQSLTARNPPQISTRDALQQALLPYIQDHNLNNSTVAELCGMNKRTLARKLKARGSSIKNELNILRRHRAEMELSNGSLSVTEIASRVGYTDPTVFSRAFKRWTGTSPRQFRKNLKSGFRQDRE